MSRILVSGTSGFIGRSLCLFLNKQSHTVIPLSRNSSHKDSVIWNPSEKKANLQDFENFDAVIHLAAEPLTLSRWSEKKREKILKSREEGASFLLDILSRLKNPPKTFLSASAIGFYGDRGEELLKEDSSLGRGFLAEVCKRWEKQNPLFLEKGGRVVYMRFGIVLGKGGGALSQMLPIYKMGLGATLGRGDQWISWIAKEDLLSAIDFLLSHEEIQGAVNLVSPQPVRQKTFSQTLAKKLNRPHFLMIPAWVLRLFFTNVADEMLLSSAKVSPSKLLAANFHFSYPDLPSALLRAIKNKDEKK